MGKLILLRHGQSLWNKLNLFTGWVDIPLSKKGVEEALEAGRQISHVPIDLIITTTLVRAQMTAFLAMSVHETTKIPVVMHTGEGKLEEWGKIYSEETAQHTIPVIRCWELNERMYGELQGLNKAETAERFGQDQVKLWRRSYNVPPPNGESLEMTAARSIPYFKKHVVPHLKEGKNVLIVAHGNSLRSIIMQLDGLSKEEVVKLELPTGVPVFYNCQDGKITKE